MNLFSWETALFVGGSAIVCGVVYKIIKKTQRFKGFQCGSKVDEKLFNGSENGVPTLMVYKQPGLPNLYCIHYAMFDAKRSVDACFPSLMSANLTQWLLEVQKKGGVKMRVVVNSDFNQVSDLLKHGIQVKVMRSSRKIQYEFMLVDAIAFSKDSVAVVCALDHNVSRLTGKQEKPFLTAEHLVLVALKYEFGEIWDSCAESAI